MKTLSFSCLYTRSIVSDHYAATQLSTYYRLNENLESNHPLDKANDVQAVVRSLYCCLESLFVGIEERMYSCFHLGPIFDWQIDDPSSQHRSCFDLG